MWWRIAGSNRWPPECKSGALPAELIPREMVGRGRLERPTSPLSGVRSNHLSYRPLAFMRHFNDKKRNEDGHINFIFLD